MIDIHGNSRTAQLHSELLGALSNADRRLLGSHLEQRMLRRTIKADLQVVFDLLIQCNLRCIGCSVTPIFTGSNALIPLQEIDHSTSQVLSVLGELERFVAKHQKTCSIIFGGGEPFLRPDLGDILRKASLVHGAQRVGVDTNGNVDGQATAVLDIAPFIGYLGLSIDGLEKYHDRWRGVRGSYHKVVDLLKEIGTHESVRPALEVTSVATRENMDSLPELVTFLASLGVRKYSIHRAMPVGRMTRKQHLIPTAADYLRLTINMIRACRDLNVEFHMHHTIESIYAALLLGLDVRSGTGFGNPDQGSSIGITPTGRLIYDPWSTGPPWRDLFEHQLSEDVLLRAAGTLDRQHQNLRCHGCPVMCSGGSRIAAAAATLTSTSQKMTSILPLVELETAVDPACPLDHAQ